MRGIVHILVASLLVYCVSAQALCAKNRGKTIGCLHSKDAGEDIEFQIDTNVKVGYIGFGLGSDMSRAEIYVAWEYEGEVVLSRRSSSGRVEPKATEQIHTVIKSSVSPDGIYRYISYILIHTPLQACSLSRFYGPRMSGTEFLLRATQSPPLSGHTLRPLSRKMVSMLKSLSTATEKALLEAACLSWLRLVPSGVVAAVRKLLLKTRHSSLRTSFS